MTPCQLARAECANLLPDGTCLGIRPEDLIDYGQVKVAHPKERCLLAKSGTRCRYFEEVVLPLADQKSPKDEPNLQARLLKAREAYWRQVGGLPIPPKGIFGRPGELVFRDGSVRFVIGGSVERPSDATEQRAKPRRPSRAWHSRECPDCHAPLAKRRRYCDKCKAKRRRGSYRESRKTE